MGTNKDMITISFKTATYEDLLTVKSFLQQDPNFTRRLKEHTKRNTVSWDDVGRFLIKILQFAEQKGLDKTAITHMDM